MGPAILYLAGESVVSGAPGAVSCRPVKVWIAPLGSPPNTLKPGTFPHPAALLPSLTVTGTPPTASTCSSTVLDLNDRKDRNVLYPWCPYKGLHIQQRAVLVVLTEEFDLVLKVSLDGQSLQDAAQQSRWFGFTLFTAGVAQLQLNLQEGLQTCRL